MAAIFYKWLFFVALSNFQLGHHPLFVSVTTIEHNATSKTLEVSCKIFTDDLETVLRKKYAGKVDLLDPSLSTAMKTLVNNYIQKHLSINADGKATALQFIGFEQQEEGIISYFEIKNIAGVKKMEVVDTILYEEKPQQMEIIHVTVKGERKSSRLNNPDSKAIFEF